jgi:CRISPR-associated protein Cmr5
MAIKELERDRAKFAYNRVEEVSEDSSIKHSEYKSYCKKIPSMIQTNGLSATFAFMYSKGKTYGVLYNEVDKWLIQRYKGDADLDNEQELMKKLLSLESTKYRKVTIEILALFNWLRRFADGKL